MINNEELGIAERQLRDKFAARLSDFRPNEKLLGCEITYRCGLRSDMETIDKDNTVRIWEFKLNADYSAIGQLIVYMAMKRNENKGKKKIVGVLAAVEIPKFIEEAIYSSGLNIEVVSIPKSTSENKKFFNTNKIEISFPA